MQITHKNMPAGIKDRGVEFYAVGDNKVHAFHNGKLWKSFRRMPKYIHTTLRGAIKNPKASLSELERYAFQYHGGLDNIPDIDANGQECRTEYFENHNAKFDNGTEISPAQLRVLELIEYSVDEIAAKLFRSPYTVARQIQDMLKNSGLPTAKSLTKWATQKGII